MCQIKRTIKNLLKMNDNSRWYFALKYSIFSIPFYLFRILPIDKKKVVVTSFKGRYGGDPRYIAEELRRTASSIDLVYLLDHTEACWDGGIRRIRYGSIRAVYELVTAKVWIDDCRKEGYVRKRKGQFYIGTGHGGIPMKKIEKDAEDKLTAAYLMLARNDSDMTDLKPSNSRWRTAMLRRAFWYTGEILNCGLPSVERLIKDRAETKKRIRQEYHLGDGSRLFLYAPTFRNTTAGRLYDLDYQEIVKAFEKRFGGSWVGIRRLHPNVRNYDRIEIPGNVIDATDYPDMVDLLLASDSLLTDYSSCIFDTLFLDIPAFIYATDLKEYTEKERGLYWNINELPFPVATIKEELVKNIMEYDPERYAAGIVSLKTELGLFDDQMHATETLVNRIVAEMDK